MSQASASSQPPPSAIPLTAAMDGTDERSRARNTWLPCSLNGEKCCRSFDLVAHESVHLSYPSLY